RITGQTAPYATTAPRERSAARTRSAAFASERSAGFWRHSSWRRHARKTTRASATTRMPLRTQPELQTPCSTTSEGIGRSGRSPAPGRRSDVELEAVVGELVAFGLRQLARTVGEEEALRPRLLEGLDRLVEREMTSWLAVELAAEERRLADEQIRVAGGAHQLPRRRRVAGVGEDLAVGLDPERVRLEHVVGHARRGDRQLADLERQVRLVLVELERPLEHVGEAESLSERREGGGAARLHPEGGPRDQARR